ncbi:BlaI/MecI/CopY family transcriptional regulator [Halpernia sp.]|uniref:BlaI/MecI/CopY family transcriptional regulator n=1 Tax=Halpernia sp. TaxID=2782209 RepID=UPI003A9490EC
MKITNLTPSEEDIMQALWSLNTAYLRDIMAELPEPKPHQNTVSTYLKILVEKEFLKTEKEGRIFKYEVIIPLEEFQNFKLKQFIKRYFKKNSIELVERLLDLKTISTEDLHQFFEVKTSVIPKRKKKKKKKTALREFVEELTEKKKKKKKK